MNATARVRAEELPAGAQVRTRSGVWTAVTPAGWLRWRHEDGNRTAADGLISDWLGTGVAQLEAAP